jgi:putative ABC transport system permease protein
MEDFVSKSNTAVRLQASEFAQGIRDMEGVWKKFVKEKQFHFEFLDQQLAEQYHSEQTTRKVFTAFSIMAIFIACIGLLGLPTYATQQRVREISIRTILGASVSQIIQMLSKDFLKLVLLASLIAFPFAWWAMHVWLQDFVYRININPWIFAIAALSVLIVALLTISFQAVKAALTSPVKSLRTE